MWKLKATFEKCIRKKKQMKRRERKKMRPTSPKRMRKVRKGRDLKMRKVVSELSPVWKMSRILELFREHIIRKHNKFKFISLWMLWFGSWLGALEKHMEGNDIHHNAQTQVLHLYVCFVMMRAAPSHNTSVLCMIRELCGPPMFFLQPFGTVVSLVDKHKHLLVSEFQVQRWKRYDTPLIKTLQ